MDSERMRVLEMLERRQITAQEAAKLLDALGSAARSTSQSAAKVLRIRVIDDASGRTEANVTLPWSLARAAAGMGIGIGRNLSPEFGEVDLARVLAAIETGEAGKVVDVAMPEARKRVEVSVE